MRFCQPHIDLGGFVRWFFKLEIKSPSKGHKVNLIRRDMNNGKEEIPVQH